MKFLLTICIFLIFNIYCYSQQLKETLLYPSNQKEYIIKSIITDNLQNRYLYGSFDQSMKLGKNTYNSYGMFDLFIIKTDSSNNIIWVNTLGSYRRDIPGNLVLDDSNNVYINGFLLGDGYLNYSKKIISNKYSQPPNTSFSFLIKFDSSGKYQWRNYVGGAYNAHGVCCYSPDPNSEFPLIYNKQTRELVSVGFNITDLSYTYIPYYDSIKYINLNSITGTEQIGVITVYDISGKLKSINSMRGVVSQKRMIKQLLYDHDNSYYIICAIVGAGNRVVINFKDTLILSSGTLPFVTYMGSGIIKFDKNWKLQWGKFLLRGFWGDYISASWTKDSNILLFGYGMRRTMIDTVLYNFNDTGIAIASTFDREGHLLNNKFYTDTNLLVGFTKAVNKTGTNETFAYGFNGFVNNNYKGKWGGLTLKNNAKSYILSKLDSNMSPIRTARIDGVKQHYLFNANYNYNYINENTSMGLYYNPMKGIIYVSGIMATDSLRVYFNNDSNLVYTSPNLNNGSMVLAISDSNFVGIGPMPTRLCRGQGYNMPVAARAAFGTNNKFTLYISPVDSIVKNTDSIATKKTIVAGDYIYFTVPNNITGKYKLTMHSDSVSLWSNQLEVYIDSLPTVSVSASKNPVCISDSVLLVSIHSHAGKWWLPGNKKPVAKDSIWIVAKSTNYYIYESGNGGCIIYDTLKLKVNPQPVASAGRDTAVCKDNYYLMLGNGGVNYMWSNGVNSAFNYVQITNDTTFQLTVSDSIGCSSAIDSVNFKILSLPSVSWGGASKKLFCPTDDSIILVAGSPAGGTFGGNGIKGNYFYPKLSGAGKHIISYSIIGNNGCTNSATDIVQVSKAPLALVNVTGITRECEGDSLTLFNADTTNYKKFLWSTGDTTVIIKARKTGNYTVTVTDTQGCSATSPAQNLVFNPTPSVYITYINGKLKCISSPAAKTWLWRLDGNQLPNDTTDEINNPAKGTYGVKIKDIHGCIGYSAAYVFTGIYNIPGNDYYIQYDHAAKTISIYNCPVNTNIRMVDASGRYIYSGTCSGNPTVVDMSSFAPGLYNIVGDKGTFKVLWW